MAESKIYAAMCAAMADIGAVTKSKINQQQHFNYRGIDDVMNALYPVLSKHGLFLVPEVLEHRREERASKNGGNLIYSLMKIKYTMFACDGSSVSAVVIGEGMDSADKSSNKAMAVAMKYALFLMFCIPTEEMANDDPDRTTPPESVPHVIDRKAVTQGIMDTYGKSWNDIQTAVAAAIEDGSLTHVNGNLQTMSDSDFNRCMQAVSVRFRKASECEAS